MGNKNISVFEHETIFIDGKLLKEEHYKALLKFNDLHGNKYFNAGYNKLTFKSYVGAIQVGDKVIEILPKADKGKQKDPDGVRKWQGALLYMLERAGYIRLNETTKATQDSSKHNLLEIYLYVFLKEVEVLIHKGLLKKYRRAVGNGKALKGRLLISQQIQHNLVHKERFYIEHTVYDSNNLFNSVLKKALIVIAETSGNYAIKREASRLLIYFDSVNTRFGDVAVLEKITFDRKSSYYSHAIELAKLIIQNYSPDFSAGRHNILAILFDMNKLFEKFVYKCLKRTEKVFAKQKLVVKHQSKLFWENRNIIPDIILTYETLTHEEQKIIVDTKWKIISNNTPSDADLKQMYAYNLQFGAFKSILFYPKTDQINLGMKEFSISATGKELKHGCELYFTSLFENGNKISDLFAMEFLKQQLIP